MILVPHGPPQHLPQAQKLRGALLIPSTDPAIPSILDEPLPPGRFDLGMVPATLEGGVMIIMPASDQHSGDSQTNRDEEKPKQGARGPEV